MNLDFLPVKILNAIKFLELDKLYEIRLRYKYPIKICYKGRYRYLSNNGVTILISEALICSRDDIDAVVFNITEQSLYAYNEKIKNGFITTEEGIRIGLCGDCVYDEHGIVTIKNYNSLNIRIPHFVKNCSQAIYDTIKIDNEIESTLIISPPFYGKTTLLKDLALKINADFDFSILIIDERGEFSSISGENIDTIRYSDKFYAFNNGVRVMAPKIIITDELVTKNDWSCVKSAVNCGVKIIATCHSKNLEQLVGKKFFIKNLFEKYVVINDYAFLNFDIKIYNKELIEI